MEVKSVRTFDPVQDDKNWKLLFEKHFQDLQSLSAISTLWISGFSKLGIVPYTGYTFIQTDENIILEQIEWYRMIAQYEMPLTTFVRTIEELEYCDEPDIWHDIMGFYRWHADRVGIDQRAFRHQSFWFYFLFFFGSERSFQARKSDHFY